MTGEQSAISSSRALKILLQTFWSAKGWTQNSEVTPADFEYGVRSALSEHGYNLHPATGWRVYSRHDEPEITGAILTRRGKIELPQHMLSTMRQLARSNDPHDALRLQGYRAYETMMKQK